MKRKYLCFCLLLLCVALLVGCGMGDQPTLPNDGVYYNVTYVLNMPHEPYREYTEKVLRGQIAPDCSQPGNEEYELEGWYLNGVKWNFYNSPVTEDIRLEPNWIRREYTVQYRIGNYIRAEVVMYYGETAEDLYQVMPERFTSTKEWEEMLQQGNVFVGWMLDGELWDFENDVVTENIVLDAYFVPADEM